MLANDIFKDWLQVLVCPPLNKFQNFSPWVVEVHGDATMSLTRNHLDIQVCKLDVHGYATRPFNDKAV